jgi:mono/diheme cytochrome c family protein
MKPRAFLLAAALATAALAPTSCAKPEPPPPRPSQVLDFATLYSHNCAACHGVNGMNGAAISLANPPYIAMARVSNIQAVTAAGVPGTLMPAFARSSGGMLTDAQVAIIANGIVSNWGNPWGNPAPRNFPLYGPGMGPGMAGDPARGQQVFAANCSNCHPKNSLTDPDYLTLISDQGLRSFIFAGHSQHQLNLSGQEAIDTVAWLATRRTQPYETSETSR